jgi:hypothetical protein
MNVKRPNKAWHRLTIHYVSQTLLGISHRYKNAGAKPGADYFDTGELGVATGEATGEATGDSGI